MHFDRADDGISRILHELLNEDAKRELWGSKICEKPWQGATKTQGLFSSEGSWCSRSGEVEGSRERAVKTLLDSKSVYQCGITGIAHADTFWVRRFRGPAGQLYENFS